MSFRDKLNKVVNRAVEELTKQEGQPAGTAGPDREDVICSNCNSVSSIKRPTMAGATWTCSACGKTNT